MSDTSNGALQIDIGTALGADAGISLQCISVYVPNKDKEGRDLGNQRKWVLEALTLLVELNDGASAMPPIEGVWSGGGTMVWEQPVVVYSYLLDPMRFVAGLPRLREFLHRMGRETNQGEIAFEFDKKFYRIRTFDSGAKP